MRKSFKPLAENLDAMLLLFYGRLFELDPSLRALFRIDMETQARKLGATLDAIIETLHRFDDLRPELIQMGRRHARYGVLPDHYRTLGDAFLWAAGRSLGDQFERETKAAWVVALGAITAVMLESAAT